MANLGEPASCLTIFEENPSTRQLIILIAVPILLLLGIPGNILSIIVMTRKRFANNVTSVFLVALAISDNAMLLMNSLTTSWIKILSCVDLPNHSDFACKLIKYVVYVSKAYGAWILVAVNLERLLVVTSPLKAKLYLSVKKAKFTSFALFTVMLIIYSHVPILDAVQHENEHPGCGISDDYVHITRALNIFDLVFYSFVPSIVIMTTNSILAYTLRHKSMCKYLTKDCLRLTVTLGLVSTVFLGLTLPFTCILVYNTQAFIANKPGVHENVYLILYALNLLNSSVNFLLYCVGGPIFRKEIKAMYFKCTCTDREIWKVPSISSRTYHVSI